MIQVFASPTEDGLGFGQGKNLIGSFTELTDDDGNVAFSVPVAVGTAAGQYVSATATDPVGNTSEFCEDVVAQGQVKLVVSAAANPSPVLAGNDLTYNVTVTNQGNETAQFVSFTDQLPSSVSLVSIALSQGDVLQRSGPAVDANLGNIPAQGTATVTIVVQTSGSSEGTITESATVSCNQTDSDPDDEAVTLNTTVLPASDVSVALSASPDPVLLGSDLTYTMQVSSLGPDVAGDVIATLPLASGVTFVSAGSSSGTVTYAGGQVVADLGDMPVGVQASVHVVVQVETVGDLSETATVTTTSPDHDLANNSATAVTLVNPSADLSVNIAAYPIPVATNHDFAYSVVASNAGPSEASDVVVTDQLPAGVTFISASSAQGGSPTFSNGVVSLTIANAEFGRDGESDDRGRPDRRNGVHLDGHRFRCGPARPIPTLAIIPRRS